MKIIAVTWVLVIAGCVGWVMNAYKLTQLDFQSPIKAEAIRGAGLFVPIIGAIAGYMPIED